MVLWAEQGRIDSSWSFARRVLLAYLVLIAVGLAIFGGWLSWSSAHYPITFLAIPILVWMAFRLGRRVTATAVVLLIGHRDLGHPARLWPVRGTERERSRSILLQAYMSVMAVTALTLAVAAVDRARMELALEEQRTVQHMAALVEASNDAIFSTRLDGTILSWNKGAERLFGYGAEEIEGGSLSLLSLPRRERRATELARVPRAGETLRRPRDDVPGERTAGWSRCRSPSLRSGTCQATSRQDPWSPATSRSRSAPRRRCARSTTSWTRSPPPCPTTCARRCASSRAWSKRSWRTTAMPSTSPGAAWRAGSPPVASRMDALTQRLLDYSRVSRVALPLGPVGLDEIVHDACAQLAEEIRFRNALVEISPQLPSVIAHEGNLAHVIGNLLSNAIKFVEPDVSPIDSRVGGGTG